MVQKLIHSELLLQLDCIVYRVSVALPPDC